MLSSAYTVSTITARPIATQQREDGEYNTTADSPDTRTSLRDELDKGHNDKSSTGMYLVQRNPRPSTTPPSARNTAQPHRRGPNWPGNPFERTKVPFFSVNPRLHPYAPTSYPLHLLPAAGLALSVQAKKSTTVDTIAARASSLRSRRHGAGEVGEYSVRLYVARWMAGLWPG